MNTRLHLLSMPMHDPLHPSSQIGYLHGHVRRSFGDQVPVRSYSAHTSILFDLQREGMKEYFVTHRLFGEELFFLACCHALPRMFERVFACYGEFPLPEVHVTPDEVAALVDVMRNYLDTRVIPHLEPGCLHVIGLTTTFAQLFASIFAARYLRERSDADLLFVFGGASMTLPEANRALELWEVRGLRVTGSGEAPLDGLLRACLALDDADAGNALDRVAALDLVNVHRIGAPTRPIDLSLARGYIDGLGDPDYDEFFATLRGLCASDEVYAHVLELVAVPLEGSRGCFARCDFCQNPNITTQFRSLGGRDVAARARRLADAYGPQRMYFADSVCNTWAEAYADDLRSTGDSFAAFMEMRVHAPEAFFTKLALAGVNEMQLGVEAVSEPLLRAMRKGTRVIQNLRASKYLIELGIDSASNLITHHPKSTVADVAETIRVVRELEHFPGFCLSKFVISYASPIYNELSDDQRSQLVRGFTWLPDDLLGFSMVRDLAYPYPDEWLDPAVRDAWDAFRRWHRGLQAGLAAARPVFTVERRGDERVVVDSRFAGDLRYTLTGALARVFDACHAGPTVDGAAEAAGVTPAECAELLAELLARRAVLRVGEHHITLALRPRADLVAALRAAPPRRPRALAVFPELTP